jgi:hypothetical protein
MFTLEQVVPWGRSFDEYEFQRGANEMMRIRGEA